MGTSRIWLMSQSREALIWFSAAFVFLDLLERDVEFGTELFLGHAKKRSTETKPFADIQVDGVVVRDPEMAFCFRVGRHAARLAVETSG